VCEAVQEHDSGRGVRSYHGLYHRAAVSPADSYLLLRALVDELARCGVRHACTSPGSRCTPIVLTLARDQRIRSWSHIDERCAGFFAVGLARACGQPAVVTCTSGTAAANLLPAVIEAREGRVPMIVLTADRPPELREVGAGQTIDQLKLFGGGAKWFFELGEHEATAERLRWVRALSCRMYWTAIDAPNGVVHLNVPLREPLVLDGPLAGDAADGGRPDGSPWVSVDRSIGDPPTPRRHEFDRTVFVAGAIPHDPGLGRALSEFAARARVPLLADPLSNARRGSAAIAHYDLILREPATAAALAPAVICRIGELPTSKPLRAWLAGLDCVQVTFTEDNAWLDPDSTLVQRTVTVLPELLARLPQDEVVPDSSDWLERWVAADAAAGVAIAGALPKDELSEPAVAAIVGSALPERATLFVASSMPIRDIETYMAARDDPPRVLSNRGANGIDGTVSSAFGAAAAGAGPVVLLIGDLALAHDIGGLMAARRTDLAIAIVLVNNDGGGIFHFLPVEGERDAFERHVATPHGLRFRDVAAAYGCQYEQAADRTALLTALQRALAGRETTIIEVRTERAANLALHRRVERAVRDHLIDLQV
jgi:2-succinyl-5-enolpyruvyl-6-hydroxy-3-cyclohexene-1-carboxylate synthase